MAERPEPFLNRWRELTVPPEDLAELAGWLAVLIGYISGRFPPASARQPVVSRKLAAYADLARRGAADFAAAQHRAAAGRDCAPATRRVLAPAQPLSSSGEMITVTDAAVLLGVKPQRVRQLAGSGRISGRKTARDVWELDRGSVIACGEQRRRGRGDGGGEATGGQGEGRGGRPGGGAAAAA
jgi:hypothetical protein